MKTLITGILLFFLNPFAGLSQSPDDLTTFILVRHAEKVDESADPELSEEGYQRVARLVKMLEYESIDAIYSTPLIRTRETVRPIAEKFNIEMVEYDHRNPEEVASNWIEKHQGETVLISGHSNSTPTFANALLGEEHFPEKFAESDYKNLLIVTISSKGERKLLHLRF